MTFLKQDLRYAFRMMRKRPVVSAAAVLTLALGIGANSAIFAVVNAILLKPLPYPSSDRLVDVSIAADTGFGARTSLPMADFLVWQSTSRAAYPVVAYQWSTAIVTGGGDPERVVIAQASAGLFEALGITPVLGRAWHQGEDDPGAPRTVVVGHAFWERRLNSSLDALGRTLTIEGRPHVVIGVAPPGFAFPAPKVELWSILPLEPPARRGPFFLNALARLKPGASIEEVRADLQMVGAEVLRKFPKPEESNNAVYGVEPLKEVVTGDARPALHLLLAAVFVVLLVAIGNVANLLLAGAAEREREIAMRVSLGAGRGRVLIQLLTEGFVLAVAGGLVGWALAIGATRALVALSPPGLPRLSEIQMDSRVFAFTLFASVVSGLLIGALPALHVSNKTMIQAIASGARSSIRPGGRRFRNALVVGEMALALALAVDAALLTKSLIRLQQVNVGFPTERILTVSMEPPETSYPEEARVVTFFEELLRRVEALPGVTAACLTNSLPPDGLSLTDNFIVEDRLPALDGGAPVGPMLFVSNDYFRTLGIPLLRGRSFNDLDKASSIPVTMISEAMAKEFFPGLDPIGRRLKNSSDWRSANPWLSIVGVVGDVKYAGLAERAAPAFYVPFQQSPFRYQNLVVRTTADPSTIGGSLREVLRSIDPNLPLATVRTMDQRVWESTAPARFRTALMSLLGTMGLGLAAIGIYSVIAFSVAVRGHEIGLRAALGATSVDLLGMVLGESMRMAAMGATLGLALALAGGRLIAALLFSVNPMDAAVLAGATLVLMFVALIAALVPARRAAAMDPIAALRAE